jgi:hypothetical protein
VNEKHQPDHDRADDERAETDAALNDAALDETSSESDGKAPPPTVPPFTPAMLRRQLAIDAVIRWGAVGVFASGLVLDAAAGDELGFVASVLVVVALVGWVGLSMASARVAQALAAVTAMIDLDPRQAEALLAMSMRRKPIQRSIRLLLFHRLAMLRHRQSAYPEAAAVCHELLLRRLGAAERVRVHLLLLLVESRLHADDLPGAYIGLSELHERKLSLTERLQLVALQTRYDVAAGHDAAALARVGPTVRMAELMPAAQCGAVHDMLAGAADRSGLRELAAWLHTRADLLATREQMDVLIGADAAAMDGTAPI